MGIARVESPEKRRFEALSDHTPSPIARKRPRFESGPGPDVPGALTLSGLSNETFYAFDNVNDIDNLAVDQVQTHLHVPEAPTPPSLQHQLDALQRQSHENRLANQEDSVSGKGTESAYARHIKNYVAFWVEDQARRQEENPLWIAMNAHPITVTKAAIFLEHETTRNKCTPDGRPIAGTRVGAESIKQCISALESYRYNHCNSDPEYLSDPQSQLPLRSDARITTYESNAQAKEPQRLTEAQELKAFGAASDTYTQEELIRISSSFLDQRHGTKPQTHLAMRDRCMILISAATAFRGDNVRRLLLSDLYSRDVPMVEIGLNAKVMALVLMSDQGKTNTTGRIDEQAAFRHRLPELCPIGALGFYLFSKFHVVNNSIPNFAPDYEDPRGGGIGLRSWYQIHLFPGSKDDMTEMTYENHRKRVNTAHVLNEISIRKVTHAGRPFAAMTAREHRATSDDTKALGNWSQNGSFRKCYDTALPTDAMLAAASFNGRRQDSYFIPRDQLAPPQELLTSIFPWVEDEQSSLQDRQASHGRNGGDVTLRKFLDLLCCLRRIILQDAAVLSHKFPSCSIFAYAPFNTPVFRTFAATSSLIINNAEQQARHQLSSVPSNIAQSLHGIITSNNIMQEQARQEIQSHGFHVTNKLQDVEALIRVCLTGSHAARRQATALLIDRTGAQTSTSSPGTPLLPAEQPISPASLACNDANPFEGTSSDRSMVVSLTGHLYAPITFPLSEEPSQRSKQLAALEILEKKYGAERLRHHTFEWRRARSQKQSDEWLPFYLYWKPPGKDNSPSIEEIWNEWTVGMDGQLSVRDLNTGWDARWRRDNGALKTEAGRRKKIIALIDKLSAKPNWNYTVALRFLNEKYPIPTPSVTYLRTTRAFTDYLQSTKHNGIQEVLEASKLYI
ncbi:hypothetical protein D9615_006350 [Tricholomella constricta]|uniref:Ndc10 domain-containing protein n=1 Tax=Tricholomella constricta TaxID=117010 RepID=A0A8H5H5F9_9AGAR|nr:hypothetical protein D9615_006350 [Tricholomella constricta]